MFVYRTRVFADDTDFTGVVYHGNYLKLAEHARTEWLDALGIPLEKLGNDHYFFVIRHADVDYIKAARMGDHLIITAKAVASGRTSITIEHSIHKSTTANTPLEEAELINRITVKVVCINEHFRPRPLPPQLKETTNHEP